VMLKGIERFTKGLLRALLIPFLRTDRVVAGLGDSGLGSADRIRRLLIVKQDDRLGNLILMTPMLSALREKLPQAEIHMLLSDLYAPIFEADSRVDRVLTMEKRRQITNPLLFLSFLRRLRDTRYDLVFEASDVDNFSFNNSFIARLANSEVRIGYAKRGNRGLLNLPLEPPQTPVHATDMYLDLLRPLWDEVRSVEMSIDIPPDKIDWARSRLESWGFRAGDFKVAIHVGGRGRKSLPREGIRELSRRVAVEFDTRLIFIAGPAEEELLISMRETAPSGSVFVNDLSILELASLLANLDLFISADTGPMHLAAACGCVTISIFTTSEPRKFAPRGGEHRYVRYGDGDFPLQEIMEKIEEAVSVSKERC
jgi:ADP-heptose:LPS heptosyltransferase